MTSHLTSDEEIEIENIVHDDDNDETDSDVDEMSQNCLSSIYQDMQNLRPYQFEPENNFNSPSDSNSDSDSSVEASQNYNNAQRIGNIIWCQCHCCVIEKRDIDCLCCQEEAAISEDKFEGIYTV